MLFSIVPFISLADPANGGMPGSWEPTYSFTTDPAYGDATYPAGYTDLWGPEMQHMVRQLSHCGAEGVRQEEGVHGCCFCSNVASC